MRTSSTIAFLAVATVLLAGVGTARANGFFVQEMSAAGMAQAGALVAAGGRPTSQFQNAANLSFSPGGHVEFSGTTYFIHQVQTSNPFSVRRTGLSTTNQTTRTAALL